MSGTFKANGAGAFDSKIGSRPEPLARSILLDCFGEIKGVSNKITSDWIHLHPFEHQESLGNGQNLVVIWSFATCFVSELEIQVSEWCRGLPLIPV